MVRTAASLLALCLLGVASRSAGAASATVDAAGGTGSSSSSSSGGVTKYNPVGVSVPSGSDGASQTLQIMVPTKGERQIADPATLMQHVKGAWDAVVEENQAGLVDAKQMGKPQPPLSQREAWHHFEAGRNGVIDSGRFLITFGLIPSVQSGGTPLHIAASMGHAEQCQALLDDGADVDAAKATDGTTPLHAAATMGYADVVALLLAEGANVEAVGSSGITPLMAAASMGHLNATAALLRGSPGDDSPGGGGGAAASAGANADAAHKFAGTTALHFAAEMGRSEVVALLCAHGADVEAAKKTGGTPLHTAADTNQSASVATLLAPPCSADGTKLMMGDTQPLYLAAQRGFAAVCMALIDGGADVNFVMPLGKFNREVMATGDDASGKNKPYYDAKNTEIGNGATALHVAVENGHLEVARLLLSRGAKQLTSMEGASPLVLSIQYRHPDIAALLLEMAPSAADAKVNVKVPKDGSSPLYAAAGYGYAELVRLLLAAGAEVDITNKAGATPLSHAVHRGQMAVVEVLLAAGADAGGKDGASGGGVGGGAGVLLTAVHSGNVAMVERVLMAAARKAEGEAAEGGGRKTATAALLRVVRAPGEDGSTALHLACERGNARIAALLLRAGAEADATITSTGASPLMMAAKAGSAAVLRLLLDAGADRNRRAGAKLHGAGALYLAAQNGHLDAVKVLAEYETKAPSSSSTKKAKKAKKAKKGKKGKKKEGNDGRGLLKVNMRLKKIGITALFIAAERGHAPLVKYLLAHGARPSLRQANWNGIVPFHMAVLGGGGGGGGGRGQGDVLETLREAWPESVNVRAKDGTTPLMDAVQSAGPRAVQFLLQHEASINAVREVLVVAPKGGGGGGGGSEGDGATPLLLAVAAAPEREKRSRDGVQLVRALLSRGADARAARRDTGETALLLAAAAAAEGLAEELVRALLAHRTKEGREEGLAVALDAVRRADGATALMLAASAGRKGVAKMLLEAGASASEADAGGRTALDRAKGRRDFDMIQLISGHTGEDAGELPQAAGAGVGGAEEEDAQTAMFRAIDADADGSVNRRELLRALKSGGEDGAGGLGERIAEGLGLPTRHVRQEGGSRDHFERVFQAIDADSDRKLSEREFLTSDVWSSSLEVQDAA